jgi:inward rectifier potassium channel
MEPLFEPLLQTSVGTQRLQNPPSHVPIAHAADVPLLRGARLLSAPVADNSPGLAVDEAGSPGDYLLPEPHRQQLQNACAGDVNHDDDETSTDGDEDETSPGRQEDADDDAVARRHKLLRSRSNVGNQSAVSIDVQDTPRFLNISPINIPKSYNFMQLYNSALYARWPRIILAFIIAFVVINAVFGLLYWVHASQMEVYTDISLTKYELAFYMSVHTLATIGYGSIAPSPTSSYMNFWVLAEAALGIIFTTIITGIAWSKFARPRAHIHFSSKIVITKIYGHRCLVFRAANTRHSGDVHENLFRIGVILTNRKTGLRQLYDVPLVTAEWPSIKLPATLIHIIDESSPFYHFQSVDNLSESRVSVIVLLTGLDTTFSENVYARKMYFWDDFAYNMRFADFAVLQRDRVDVDFQKFDTLEDDGESYVAPTPLWEEGGPDHFGEDDGDELSDSEERRHNTRTAAFAVV